MEHVTSDESRTVGSTKYRRPRKFFFRLPFLIPGARPPFPFPSLPFPRGARPSPTTSVPFTFPLQNTRTTQQRHGRERFPVLRMRWAGSREDTARAAQTARHGWPVTGCRQTKAEAPDSERAPRAVLRGRRGTRRGELARRVSHMLELVPIHEPQRVLPKVGLHDVLPAGEGAAV